MADNKQSYVPKIQWKIKIENEWMKFVEKYQKSQEGHDQDDSTEYRAFYSEMVEHILSLNKTTPEKYALKDEDQKILDELLKTWKAGSEISFDPIGLANAAKRGKVQRHFKEYQQTIEWEKFFKSEF